MSPYHRLVAIIMAICLPALLTAGIQTSFYVSPTGDDNNSGTSVDSPFQTMEKARQMVQTVNGNMTGDIHVYLRGGTYSMTHTINFSVADSASNGFRIYYQAYNDEVPVMNGGTLVTGWTQHEGNIYKASLNRTGKLRTLTVNGKRAYMAKSGAISCNGPSGTYSVTAGQASWAWISGTTADGMIYDAGSIGELNNPSYVEITRSTTWNENTVCVRDITTTGANRIFLLQQPYGAIALQQEWDSGFTNNGSTHVIHNAYELLDSPGEFYFDDVADVLYYYKNGEDLSTAQVYAPLLGELIHIQGTDINHRVDSITFKGITFAHTEAVLPEVDGSYGKATAQAAIWCMAFANRDWSTHTDQYRAYDTMPGAIVVNSADSIRFEDNVMKHIGNEGVCLINDVNNSALIGNLITDVGGSAIQVGHPQHVYERDGGTHEKYSQSEEGVCRNNLIKNNLLVDMTLIYAGHAGITAYFVNGLEILNNHIQSTQYTGVSVGWGWNNFDEVANPSNPTSVAGNNKFNNNRVYDCMKTLEDGGAFYTLGSQPNSEVNGNYIKADTLHFQGVFHPDEGTAWYNGSDMVFEIDPSQDNFELNDWRRKHDIHYDNIYTTSAFYESGAPNTSITNLHIYPDADWPQEALDIIDAAGLEEAYDSLWDLLDLIQNVDSAESRERLEAEHATLNGVVVESNATCSNGAAVGYFDAIGNSLTFSPVGASWLTIRYANANSSKQVSLYINGVHHQNIIFETTGSWGNYADKTVVVDVSGSLTLQIDSYDRAYNASNAAINVDYIEFAESYSPGLLYGTVAGNINTTDPNPNTAVTVNLAETEDDIANNTTEIYTGEIYDADGSISFTEQIDDQTRLYIDGALVLSSDDWADRVSTSNLNLTPGWHTFELRISNGSGGDGPVNSPGFGFDPEGGSNWIHPEDPGDGSLFRYLLASDTDTDGDGQTDTQEVALGTDPADPTSIFAISQVTKHPSAGKIEITWPSASGVRYKVLQSTDLINWTVAQDWSDALSTPVEALELDYTPTDARLFFRVEAEIQ